MPERTLSQAQAAQIGILRKNNDVPLHEEVRICGIRNALNVEPFLL